MCLDTHGQLKTILVYQAYHMHHLPIQVCKPVVCNTIFVMHCSQRALDFALEQFKEEYEAYYTQKCPIITKIQRKRLLSQLEYAGLMALERFKVNMMTSDGVMQCIYYALKAQIMPLLLHELKLKQHHKAVAKKKKLGI